jgi:hypothetical protein
MRQFGKDDVARYLPAVNDAYARISTLTALDSSRSVPAGFSPSDLCFWNANNRYFHYPYALHSVGLYNVGTRIDNALTRSSKRERVLLGDSGGFQLGSNAEPFGYKPLRAGITDKEAIAIWHEATELRDWIIGSLTGSCNMGMTIDIPMFATFPQYSLSAFHSCSPIQLIELYDRNLRYIENTSTVMSNYKWLNVIGGMNQYTIDAWLEKAHWFRQGGWALAGKAGFSGGIESVIYTLKRLEALGGFNDGNTWIHVLGVGTAEWAVYLTEIQRCLRERYDSINISFDNATPFSQAGRYERMMTSPNLTADKSTWAIGFENAPQGQIYTEDSTAFSTESTIGLDFSRAQLNVRSELYNPNKFDQVSHVVLANHNVYVMLDAFERANWLAEHEHERLPAEVRANIDMIRKELG